MPTSRRCGDGPRARLRQAGAIVLDGDRDAGGVVRWVEGAPEILGLGLSAPSEYVVTSITEAGDGSLWVAGSFSDIGSSPSSLSEFAFGVARWIGGRWTSVGGVQGGFPSARTIATDGASIYVGGSFDEAFGLLAPFIGVSNIARWDGTSWSELPHGGAALRGTGPVWALAARGPCGPFVAGDFTAVGPHELPYAGELDDDDIVRQISPSAYISRPPHALTVAPDGTLYAANVESIRADRMTVRTALARWRGSRWEAFGSFEASPPSVRAIAVDERGVVYVGGSFAESDPSRSHLLQITERGSWPVGAREPLEVSALLATGGDLVVAEDAGGGLSRVARFRDGEWTTLGEPLAGYVHALAAYDGTIVAAGTGLTATSSVVRWTGDAWEPLGAVAASTTERVSDLAVLGANLIAVGAFALDGAPVNAAYWQDGSWQPLGGGLDGWVGDVEVTARGLLLGGQFTSAGGVASWGIARFEPPE